MRSSQDQINKKMEQQIEQLIRIVAQLNKRIIELERKQNEKQNEPRVMQFT